MYWTIRYGSLGTVILSIFRLQQMPRGAEFSDCYFINNK